MSAVLVVQELGKSQGGKPKCKANNVWYFLPTDRDTGVGDLPAIGQVIEVDVGSFTMGNPPKSFATIERWRPVNRSDADRLPQQSQQSAPAQQAQRPALPPADPTQAFIGQGFISNVVGQAIAAKTIVEPGQILAWFNGAKAALEGKSAPAPLDDTIKNKQW